MRDRLYRTTAYPAAEFEPPAEGDSIRNNIRIWFAEKEQQYAKTWDRLRQLRRRWGRLSFEERVSMLQLSTTFAIYTIMTPLSIAEAAFGAMMAGRTVEESLSEPLREAGGVTAGQHNMKQEWIHRSIIEIPWDRVTGLLDDPSDTNAANRAQKILIDESVGLGGPKSGFVLANLGITQKLCIDGNVSNLFFSDRVNTVSIDRYEGLCSELVDWFPRLSEDLEPYEIQWLVFDFQRTHRLEGGRQVRDPEAEQTVATHDAWFSYVLGNINTIVRRMRELEEEAYTGPYGPENYPRRPTGGATPNRRADTR